MKLSYILNLHASLFSIVRGGEQSNNCYRLKIAYTWKGLDGQ